MDDHITDAPLKRCSKCGKEYPATTQFYSPAKRGKYGVTSRCRECARIYSEQRNRVNGHKPRERVIVDGKQQCTICKEWKLATPDFFYRASDNRTGLHAACKVCEKIKADRRHAENPEIRRQVVRRYYASHRETILMRGKAYDIAHPEKRRERAQRRLEENPNKVRRQSREKTQRYRDRHREIIRERERKRWYENPNMRIRTSRYHARKRNLPDTFTAEEWDNALEYFHGCCVYCGKQRDFWHSLEADHFVPLNSPNCLGTVSCNVVPACKSCNASKNDADPFGWLNSKFGKRRAREILKRIQSYFDSLK